MSNPKREQNVYHSERFPGEYIYTSQAGNPGAESVSQREDREKFWRSLGKKVRKGSRIRGWY